MAEVKPMSIDGVCVGKPVNDGLGERKRQPKRKRLEACTYSPSPEEKQAKIVGFRNEIDSLVKYCKNLVSENRGASLGSLEKFENSGASVNGVIACLMEESDLPLSKLVDDIFEKVKYRNGNGDGFSKASVKSAVLINGQRLCYGVVNADPDVLEDDAERALWYWETRDLKLLPKSAHISLKVRRSCRRKIQERISAVLGMINALEKSVNSPNCQHELMKAAEKLSKVLNEADIRLLVENMSNKNGTEIAEKEAKRGEKLLIKQMEKNKREKERERKKIERERQKEILQNERQLKQLHEEAEEERRVDKEEIERQKQLKRRQEEAEKVQRRREKEEAESRKRLVLQKQASLMERFLNRKKTSSSLQNDCSDNKAATSRSSSNMNERNALSVSLAMDAVFAQNDDIGIEDIWKSHLNAWRGNRCSIQSNRKRHWGIRLKPKTELVKELKLATNKELTCCDNLNIEKLVGGLDGTNNDSRLPQMDMDHCLRRCGTKRVPVKLLQFDKSNRPAFYGVWPKNSQVVGPRHPLVKDSDIDYDIDSDEEWEEDEPGESLSDCEKDGEDESMGEESIKDDEDGESEDGFFVPDGYLSENERVKSDEMDDSDLDSEVQNLPTSEQQLQSDEFCIMLRQQKFLNDLTEHALKKNHPLIILNLLHGKSTLSSAEDVTGISKLERMALQALTVRPLLGFQNTEISDPSDEGGEVSPNKSSTTRILDLELPQIISIIQSCPHSIKKIEKSLHDKFPAVSKSLLRKKVRKISEFSDNCWQVKKEVLRKHGLSISPEKGPRKMKSIETFLKKGCLPPSGTLANLSKTSSQSSQKLRAKVEPQDDCTFKQQ